MKIKGRGRPRKAQPNQVVQFRDHDYGVIVEYRHAPWGRYRVVRTDKQGRFPHGKAIWLDSTEFELVHGYNRPRVGRVFRKNQKEEDRGCECNCCHHIAGFA